MVSCTNCTDASSDARRRYRIQLGSLSILGELPWKKSSGHKGVICSLQAGKQAGRQARELESQRGGDIAGG